MASDHNTKKRIISILMILICWASATHAAVPLLINYQGHLTDDLSDPVSGTYTMIFSLYTVESGGIAEWTENQTVIITDGIYNVALGDRTPFPADLFDDPLYLGVAVLPDPEMEPRQMLTSSPFAMRAEVADTVAEKAVDTVHIMNNAVTGIKIYDGTVEAVDLTDGAALAEIADNDGTGSGLDADRLDGLDAAAFAPSVHNHDGQYYSKTYVDALEDRIAALEAKLQYLAVVAGTVNGMPGPHVIITGANLHVRSGSGSTSGTINGLGNLIVGYNELRGSGDDRTGSHNLVTGNRLNYSAYGGLVAGYQNTISSSYASVSGGTYNEASGDYASVSGGINNTASGDYSSVSGGNSNTASDYSANVGGGRNNTASGSSASVSGGINNTASGYSASVSGGEYNIASGSYSFVGGGGGEETTDGNKAFGNYSAILGGVNNIAGDPVLADHEVGQYSSISGGHENKASGPYASVNGGNANTASGDYSNVSGGWTNEASGDTSSISGGDNNHATNVFSSVNGGTGNTASGVTSVVSAGSSNTASGNFSCVSGGQDRSVSGNYDWRAGDYFQDN